MKASLLFAGWALGFALLLPNHYPPWAAFHAEAMATLALVPLALWSGFQRRRLDALAAGAMALSLVPLLQLVAGQIYFAGDAWMACLYIVGFGLAVHCGRNLSDQSPDGSVSLEVLVPIQVGLLCASLISTGMAACQWLGLGPVLFVIEKSADSRPFANLSQPNQLASLLMLGLAATAFLFEAKKVRASLALLAAIFLTSGLAMTQSRTPLLGLTLAWLAYFGLRRRAELRIGSGALLAITAVYFLLAWAWPSLDAALLLKHAPSLTERMSGNLRLVLWRTMLDAVLVHPWGGWGWGQVTAAQQAMALDSPATHWWFESTHNLVLDVAIWAGVPVGVAVSGALLVWFLRCVRACRDPLSWCLLVGLGCIFCHAMVEFPLYYAYFLLPVGLLMGAVGAKTSPGRSLSPRSLGSGAARVVIVAISLTAVAAYAKVVSEYFVLEQEWRDLRLSRALVGADAPAPAPGILLLTQLQARANFSRIDPTVPMSREQLDWMGHVAHRYGQVTFMFPYARALAVNGFLAEAEQELELMCKTQQPTTCSRAKREWASYGLPQSRKASAFGIHADVAP